MILTCPHCRTRHDAPEPEHTLEVVVCPVCGEVFAVLRGEARAIPPRAMEALRRDSHWPGIAAEAERVRARSQA